LACASLPDGEPPEETPPEETPPEETLPDETPPDETPPDEAFSHKQLDVAVHTERHGLHLDECMFANSPVLAYGLMLANFIENRTTISREDLLMALRKRMRQRSICIRSRRAYVLSYLNQHPP
jgi:hypothetical protein